VNALTIHIIYHIIFLNVCCLLYFQGHGGVYDDLKTVPFVDVEEKGTLYGDYVKTVDANNDTNRLYDKFEALYNKYNQKLNRNSGVGSGDNGGGNDNNSSIASLTDDTKVKTDETPNKAPVETNTKQAVNVDIKPVEGGLEDMTRYEERYYSEVERKENRKRRRNREKKHKEMKHRNSVKKDLGLKEEDGKEKPEDDLGFNMDKFYREYPGFQKNVATITDHEEKHDTTTEAFETTVKTENVSPVESESVDDTDDLAKDIFDIKDDHDDHDQAVDSESNDASSEDIEHYDLYDEDGDSSYSSSEQAADLERQGLTPLDWFNRPQNDDPHEYFHEAHDTPDHETVEHADEKMKKDKQSKKEEYKTFTVEKKVTEEEKKEMIPKTDVEPSTSPNPPTSKKGSKPFVTQPYPHWDERVNTWNLIESKPVGRYWSVAVCDK